MVSTRDRLKQTKEKLVSLLKIHRKPNSKKKDDLEMGNSNDRLTILEMIVSNLTAIVGELVEQLRLTNNTKASISAKLRGHYQRGGHSRKKGVMEAVKKDGAVLLQVLRSRRQVILDNIRDNDKAGANYQKVEVEANKKHRCQLQDMIEEAISNNTNKTYLRFLKFLRMNVE
ncbi:hypothetical protein GIB67_009796 [Kingdonia uniflora]|uniref:Uncharacterized protein n=1 Tax=Kingdonia uniflora TaxID=39325 RepID=A0A7J7LXE2_9MAGN|nr:hypothetical protein GIB67_009796 [Kingdonia uniflora]